MDDPLLAKIICPKCKGEVATEAANCPRCGQQHQPPTSSRRRRWEEDPTLIKCVLVFAALFLAFPLLWNSSRFSFRAKIFWTVLVTLETILIFWVFFWLLFKHTIPALQPILGQ